MEKKRNSPGILSPPSSSPPHGRDAPTWESTCCAQGPRVQPQGRSTVARSPSGERPHRRGGSRRRHPFCLRPPQATAITLPSSCTRGRGVESETREGGRLKRSGSPAMARRSKQRWRRRRQLGARERERKSRNPRFRVFGVTGNFIPPIPAVSRWISTDGSDGGEGERCGTMGRFGGLAVGFWAYGPDESS